MAMVVKTAAPLSAAPLLAAIPAVSTYLAVATFTLASLRFKTPFNRFVLLRCPSLVFEGSDASERHYVRGRIEVRKGREREGLVEELRYQRVCVSGADGGVVSLDWPDNLDLEEERGLDSTLLLVPGTPQGSMDADVRLFVVEALKRGYFPVVMNPRGCAASPLTTPRATRAWTALR
ncbi:Alpha/Beta hydrolase fold [Vigna unguiculata]|uniref:Alpha/Beta hydrolase fold n=1 Tax=Vigna unguiculata TaxID=3917 RepID=A0A4D6NRI5_VIGUN|nr:Alpha/Beta hydrolase fold [Vigna unguiculata]